MAVTLAELHRQVITRALGEYVKESALLTADSLNVWLSEAYIEIQRRTRIWTKSHTANLVADQVAYARPDDILDRMTIENGVMVKSSSGAITPLNERDWPYIRQVFGDLSNPNNLNGPTDWAWDDRDAEKILILWPPESAVSNGLIVDYVAHPGQLTRLYDNDTATASVTNDSATVTFAASIEGLVEADDVFGVKSSAEELPTTWYRVASVDSTTQITLNKVYAGATNASALFTLSQVSAIEWKRPGLVRFAPVEYALFKYWQMEEGDQAAASRRALWNGEVARIKEENMIRPTRVFGKTNVRDRHPAHRRF